ncbi:hypothetical protein GOARA_056_01730 [Gordonia araii NBRC 100433]|uniref:Uncharacterized protein n=1 Tax=Gordonia araii NBRC 100433 TaxID=1073574 RepID=G7H3K0_9ACTN|nr:DUF6350 family protein [Gordonia araii]NNG96542.1 hypothetical protein [Gordonia araii NBRC 100433]GAB10425.1 hypothetical protein GOARA_056_01730 [Gordonia araii NBRC 100433]
MAGQTGSLAERLRHVRQAQRERALTSAGTARELVIVAFAVPLATLALLALIVGVTLVSSGSGFGAFGTALGSAWLSLHQVPLSIGGVTISSLPLLPTIGLAVAVFAYTGPSARLRTTPADLGALVGAAIGGPLLITALALALVLDGSSVLPVNPPNALWAFAATALLYGGATTAGIARRDWRDWCEDAGLTGERFDDVVAGVKTGWLASLLLVGAAAIAVCALLVVNWPSVATVVAGGNGIDGHLGLVVLSLLYLPNVVIDAVGVLLGTTVQMGGSLVDLFNPQPGTVPALPILAIVPGPPPIRFLWSIALVVPLGIAVWAGLRMRHYDPIRNLRRVAICAATAAAVLLLATLAATGTVGELGRAGGDPPVVGVFAFGLFVVVGAIIALLHGARDETKAQRRAAAAATVAPAAGGGDAELAADPVDDDAEPAEPTPTFFRPDGDAPVVDDLEDLMFFDDLTPD